MKYEITETLAQQILRYLSIKPYNEVAPLIQQMGQLKPIEEKEPDKKD